MTTDRNDVKAALSVHDPQALRAILSASDVSTRGSERSDELAARIADAIWWNWSTPLGYAADHATLEDIVAHVARKLRAEQAIAHQPDPYSALRSLTVALLHQLPQQGVSLSDLDETTRRRVRGTWLPSFAWGGGTASSLAARWGSGRVLSLLKGPIGRLLPLIPPIAPWVGPIRTGAGAVHLVSGPLAVGLAVLTVNASLNTNYRRLVPLLLGVGALGVQPAEVAEELSEPA
jgi:hypothetical protein